VSCCSTLAQAGRIGLSEIGLVAQAKSSSPGEFNAVYMCGTHWNERGSGDVVPWAGRFMDGGWHVMVWEGRFIPSYSHVRIRAR